jgi:hypothetical protein
MKDALLTGTHHDFTCTICRWIGYLPHLGHFSFLSLTSLHDARAYFISAHFCQVIWKWETGYCKMNVFDYGLRRWRNSGPRGNIFIMTHRNFVIQLYQLRNVNLLTTYSQHAPNEMTRPHSRAARNLHDVVFQKHLSRPVLNNPALPCHHKGMRINSHLKNVISHGFSLYFQPGISKLLLSCYSFPSSGSVLTM